MRKGTEEKANDQNCKGPLIGMLLKIKYKTTKITSTPINAIMLKTNPIFANCFSLALRPSNPKYIPAMGTPKSSKIRATMNKTG